jgi:hypothetical protein
MRKKEYYNKEEIVENQYTTGKEYMTKNRVEYTGLYHKYITGEVYTLATFNANKSIPLITYQEESADIKLYKANKSKIKTKYNTPNILYPSPTADDIKKKRMTRYVLKNVSTNQIFETNLQTVKNYQKKKIDNNLYQLETIEWKITGPLNTTTINGITQIGVIEENIETIRNKTKKMSGLLQYFKLYSEFYTDTTYEIPENINQSFSSTPIQTTATSTPTSVSTSY